MPDAPKRSKKTKRPDKRPARIRYWGSTRLAMRKIRNMVRHGADPVVALNQWVETRRRNKGLIPTLNQVKELKK